MAEPAGWRGFPSLLCGPPSGVLFGATFERSEREREQLTAEVVGRQLPILPSPLEFFALRGI